MKTIETYAGAQALVVIDELVPAYQKAFAGPPWFEVSKCADLQQRCVGGLSKLAVGNLCEVCDSCTSEEAYPADELVKRLSDVVLSRPSVVLVERDENKLANAMIAWEATANRVADEKYPDVPNMRSWLGEQVGPSSRFVWLDEVFADKSVRPNGNLANFEANCREIAGQLGREDICYRTKTPQMVVAAQRDFGQQARVFKRKVQVPDRRDFVKLDMRPSCMPYWSIFGGAI